MSDTTEDIDYETLYNKVREELEYARLTLLKERFDRPTFELDLDSVREFIRENYLVIVVAIMVASLLSSILRALVDARRRKE